MPAHLCAGAITGSRGFNSLSGLKIKRFKALAHNEHKAGEIDTGHMSRRYLDNWEYRTASQLNMIAKEFEEPNRGYAFAYKEYWS